MKVIIALILLGITDIFALLLFACIAIRIAGEVQKDEEKDD